VTADLELTIERGVKPLHAEISDRLAAAIESGALAPGELLPPERRLAASLGVSRMTVRQALGELERAGLLRRVVGRGGGTFVSDPIDASQPAPRPSLSAGLRAEARVSGVEVISAAVRPSRRRAASALGLDRGAPVVVIQRLLLAGGKPVGVERTSLPARLFPDIEDTDLDGSLHELMADGYELTPVRLSETVSVVEARASDARMLGVRVGAPLLLVERIGFAADGTAIEFARDRYRSDRTRLVSSSGADRQDPEGAGPRRDR
jgi:GntR family transcriptional regulator